MITYIPSLSSIGTIGEDLRVAGEVLHIILSEVCLACYGRAKGGKVISDVI